MTDIGFYHLTRTGVAEALAALLGRTLQARERAVVRCGSAAGMAALDQALWVVAEPDWVPHGTAEAPMQPVFLTLADEAPNGARFLFLTEGAETAVPEAYARIFDVFDGRDEAAVAAARGRWTRLKAAGHTLAYRQQGPKGWSSGGADEPGGDAGVERP